MLPLASCNSRSQINLPLGWYTPTPRADSESTGTEVIMSVPEATRVEHMQAMVTKYSSDFPRHHTILLRAAQPPVDVVLLVGTTRALGSQLLVKLAEHARVRHVYALDQPSEAQSTRERLTEVLEERDLDASVLSTDKIVLIEGDPALPSFGLPQETYKQVCLMITERPHEQARAYLRP